jgi:hypothetical protein
MARTVLRCSSKEGMEGDGNRTVATAATIDIVVAGDVPARAS